MMASAQTPPRGSHSRVIADARAEVENTPPAKKRAPPPPPQNKHPWSRGALDVLRVSISASNQFSTPGRSSSRSITTAPAGVELTPLSALGKASKRRQLVASIATEVQELHRLLGAPEPEPGDNANGKAEDGKTDDLSSSRLDDPLDDTGALNDVLERVRSAHEACARTLKEREEERAAHEHELSAASQKALALEATVAESSSVLEKAVEIAMAEGLEQSAAKVQDMEERLRLMSADRQLYSDQLQALRDGKEAEADPSAGAAPEVEPEAEPESQPESEPTGDGDALGAYVEKNEQIASLEESLRQANDRLWDEQDARQAAEAGLLGAKSGMQRVQEAREVAEQRVQELEQQLGAADADADMEPEARAQASDGVAQAELEETRAQLAKAEQALEAALGVSAQRKQEHEDENQATDEAVGELADQAAEAMQRAAAAEQQLVAAGERIMAMEQHLHEELGLREAADAAVEELIGQMREASTMQGQLQQFAEAQTVQLEKLQSAYTYAEAAAEAESSARAAAERRLQAFAAMQQAKEAEQQRHEVERQHEQQQQQEQQRQQAAAAAAARQHRYAAHQHHHTWHAAQGHSFADDEQEAPGHPGGQHPDVDAAAAVRAVARPAQSRPPASDFGSFCTGGWPPARGVFDARWRVRVVRGGAGGFRGDDGAAHAVAAAGAGDGQGGY